MANAGFDVLIAARADVALRRLVRLDEAHFVRTQGVEIIHGGRSAEQGPHHEQRAEDQPRGNVEIVETSARVLARRIEAQISGRASL